ncbi:heat shock protein HspQ [Endozoicomonas sp. SM1973]|uniref:Heat shock protein HspQ n=1 Tax=Spartinivicinus marinus TaxID=2994442 RepID=A0A853I8I4_9GAMM|nr:heat shock protein HspQ [Spartinivicinus marinus]MCX4028862.1 heat shock protein HspQ [Spartinivicinus marinus]NYZ65555.1 heat shock protein HspQ [Spartinivicinus marinus]
MTQEAKFSIGQIVHHKLFNYRGVVIDIDPTFMLTDEWYQTMAKSRPPKNKPWYHVLVDNAVHQTYVAEQNLAPDDSGEQVHHPELGLYFDQFINGHYHLKQKSN